ncbi:adrenocorticotropic hormone receptor-like [Tropilaelaps mercedesae]|uniref:Adrenocorticotropic hormone receptor-like n=1 Tax=Tropilaelaps mercedesae TaxID=418985 RepID=A0A1V9X8G6_9ACAR|nr:adrenocorticotropic hormone receptor-like [Tropilaelaps mercedesae]
MSSANVTVEELPGVSDNGRTMSTNKSTEDPLKQAVYEYAVPLLVLACVISTVSNLLVLVSLRWLRRSINPTLSLSLSLTFADAYASFMCGLGFVVNSYLPVVNHSLHQCFNLVLEALRLSGLVAAALNLLALSFNHYIGILRPLHYASTVTRRSAYIGIVLLWAVPLMLFFTYFSIVSGQGFQSSDCADLRFLRQSRFSVLLGMLFTIPLMVMMFIYMHIFFIIRQHKIGMLGQGAASTTNSNGQNVICKKTSSNASVTTSLTSSTCTQASRRLQNVKAVYTTLLIIGTYLVGWMPAVFYYVFTCTDSCPFPITQISLRLRISMGVIVNALIVLKSLVDPFIYAARMPEISEALYCMFHCRLRTNFRPTCAPSYNRHGHYQFNRPAPSLPKPSLATPLRGERRPRECTDMNNLNHNGSVLRHQTATKHHQLYHVDLIGVATAAPGHCNVVNNAATSTVVAAVAIGNNDSSRRNDNKTRENALASIEVNPAYIKQCNQQEQLELQLDHKYSVDDAAAVSISSLECKQRIEENLLPASGQQSATAMLTSSLRRCSHRRVVSGTHLPYKDQKIRGAAL